MTISAKELIAWHLEQKTKAEEQLRETNFFTAKDKYREIQKTIGLHGEAADLINVITQLLLQYTKAEIEKGGK